MMMDCPRCGFSQPKDRYCANCGLDVDSHLAKPKPLWLRFIQNPNLHLGLIGLLLCAIVFYILYSRSAFLARGVQQMLGTPIASREAGEGTPPAAAPTEEPERPIEEEVAAVEPEAEEEPAAAVAPVAAVAEPKKLELAFFEVARETLRGLVANAENAGVGPAGRAFLIRTDAGKIADALRAGSRKLDEPRSLNLAAGQVLTVVTPESAGEAFQFALNLQINRFENHEATLRWDLQLFLGQPETPAELASAQPAMRAVTEAKLAGGGSMGPQSLLILIVEPMNRRPRPEFLQRAGDGPWMIFNSDDFRAQLTDWVAIVQPK